MTGQEHYMIKIEGGAETETHHFRYFTSAYEFIGERMKSKSEVVGEYKWLSDGVGYELIPFRFEDARNKEVGR